MKTMAKLALVMAVIGVAAGCQGVSPCRGARPMLEREFNLAASRTPDTKYYVMETVAEHHAEDGTRTGSDVYKLWLKCEPTDDPDIARYTVGRLEVATVDGLDATIPALEGWSYEFGPAQRTLDEEGQVFSIPHSRFVGLTDSNGAPLQPQVAYAVYNTFIDFHALCNEFALPTAEGGGIQDLKRVGDKIVHAAAFSEPPVNLGAAIKEGSYFKNGEVTLEFKGLGVVDGSPCALVTYDSGKSAFKMLLEPMPGMQVEAMGSSHYHGDLYIGLESGWVEKADMLEMVVAKVTIPGQPGMHDVIERTLSIRDVGKEAFEQD